MADRDDPDTPNRPNGGDTAQEAVPPPGEGGLALVVAGGGTGGHLFPGIAVAEEFLDRDARNRVLFIGTERGLEARVLAPLGFSLRTLKVEGLKGRGRLRAFAALLMIPGALAESFRILRDFRPDIVVGVGGYASGPAVLAARLMGLKTAIAEQNAFPGLTNRILGRFAHRIFLTFPQSGRWFPRSRTRISGNPVRADFLTRETAAVEKGRRFTVLVFGGSQGAQAINRRIGEALDGLVPLKDRLRFIHQSGERDREAVAAAYRGKGFAAEVFPFIVEMAAAYRSADLLVCRAGATSIAEITACGKAAILIPFPFAAGDHQTQNARILADAGAAEMIPEKELDGRRLAEAIGRLCREPAAVRKMEAAAAALGNRRAAADIVDACLELAGRRAERKQRREVNA